MLATFTVLFCCGLVFTMAELAVAMDSDSEGMSDADDFQDPANDDPEGLVRVDAPNLPNVGPNNEHMWTWDVYEDIDPFSPDWIPDFRKRRGILVDTDDFAPLDFFKLYFPDDLFELMSQETNRMRYAHQYLDAYPELPPNSRFTDWTDTTAAEMRAMLSLQIAMGLCSKPTVEDYWNGYWFTRVNFSKVLPRNRYQLLTSFLHFNDNTQRVPEGRVGYNPLFKIQSVIDIAAPTYLDTYQPGKELSIDESMIKFKGRIMFKQYMPAKPIKWGFKAFVLADAKTNFCLRYVIYTGKRHFQRRQNVPLGEQVVLNLVNGFDQGHVIYMDNYYSSPSLFTQLEDRGIGACGTVNPLRKHMPEDLKPRNCPLRRGQDPLFRRCDNLVATAWHDTKRVTFLSNVHTNNTVDKQVRSRDGVGGYRTVEKPVVADCYNTYMSGVDHFDQLMGTYAYSQKCSKWYMAIFHTIREIALVNGYIAYSMSVAEGAQSKMSAVKFRQEVIDGLLEGWEPANPRRAPAPPSDFTRLQEKHFLGKYEDPKYKPNCIVCGSSVPRVRRQTSYFCKGCNVPVCVIPCFEIYHTRKDVTRRRGMQAEL